MHRLVSVLLCLVLFAAACGSDEPAEEEAFSAFDALLDAVDDSGFEGVVAIDAAGDRTVRAFGTADRAGPTANTADTVFDIGSLTKQFTGAAILRLQMDGQLSVDDPIGRYVDGLTPDQAAITLHELLTHTGGLPEALGDDYDAVGLDEFVDLVAAAARCATSPARRTGTPTSATACWWRRSSGSAARATSSTCAPPCSSPPRCSTPATCFRTGPPPASPSATGPMTAAASDARTSSAGTSTGRTGTYAATAGSSRPPTTCCAGTTRSPATTSSTTRPRRSTTPPHVEEGPGAGTHYGYGWAVFPAPGGGRLITHNGGNGIFFADFLRFLDDDVTVFIAQVLSGCEFQKLPHGPAPRQLLPIRRRLIDAGEAELVEEDFLGRPQQRLVPLRPARLDLFDDDEPQTIDDVLTQLDGLTGTQVSELSHQEPGWQLTEVGETIPFSTACLDYPQIETPTSRRLATEVAERYGFVSSG